jgi:DNA-binding LacI/PurR family transcriptional regulator
VPERRDGYEAAMRQAKAKTCFIGDAIVPLKDRLEHIKNYVCSPASPTALLCYSPDDATLAFMACAQCNKQVPRDLSLVSFESKTFYIAGTALAIFKTPDYEVGKEAVSLLFRKMEDSTRKLEPVSVPFTLEAGETCAPPVA